MYYLVTIAAIYIIRFFPSFFSRPLLVLPLLAAAAVLLLSTEEGSLHAIITALLFALIAEAVCFASPRFSIPEEEASAMYGTVIQDSQQKKGRTAGFRIMLKASEDRRGNIFSADGNVYVISEQSDFYYGDEIYIRGEMAGPVIYASDARLIERRSISDFRIKAIGYIKERFRSFRGGELSALLVLGTGSDGFFGLSDDARRSGLSHVLALSGMHLSIIAILIRKPLILVFGRSGGRASLYIVLLLFAFLSGWRPSLVRALIFRIIAGMKLPMEESFILSFVLLLMLFPGSVSDLGAQYSFISLGGIFLMSGQLEKAIRFFLPIPSGLSSSIAASCAALIFSIPLTVSVFGSYQLGAIITSFPFSFLISIYMILSLLMIPFPCLSWILQILYGFIEWAFRIAGRFPETDCLVPYFILVIASFSLIAVSAVLKKRLVVRDNANLLS